MKTQGARLDTGPTVRDTGPSDAAVFDKRPEAVAHARDFARAFVDRLHPAVDPQDVMSVELTVSELVTNVVRHARGTSCSLRLRALSDGIAVAVGDADPRPPQERAPDLAGGTGGFGWPMVRHMARTVTVTRGPNGKTIRAVLPR
ncbi:MULTISPECIES: ATP-binding protein [unclassified Streptomyces]|uniref:ATP-binding protein n=1 Tax=Streptomyces sp. SYP-A7185 TaxID=3040076 RepID=UPI0038F6166C